MHVHAYIVITSKRQHRYHEQVSKCSVCAFGLENTLIIELITCFSLNTFTTFFFCEADKVPQELLAKVVVIGTASAVTATAF